jgi:hypothetical protein
VLVLVLSGNVRAHQVYDGYVQELHLFHRQNFDKPGNMRHSNAEHKRIYKRFQKAARSRPKPLQKLTFWRAGNACLPAAGKE